MVTAGKAKTGFEKWKETIQLAITDVKWNAYDVDIQKAVADFNKHLSCTKGYNNLDWHLIKAMVWTETGATKSAWHNAPIQIGNYGDPGLDDLLSGNHGGELIIPPTMKPHFTAKAIREDPVLNIQAGIAYLLMRCAEYSYVNTLDPDDDKLYSYSVVSKDSFEKIAKSHGTTVEVLESINSGNKNIHPGQVVKFKKASVKKIISGWIHISTSVIATKYNYGDVNYSKKLDYCLAVMKK